MAANCSTSLHIITSFSSISPCASIQSSDPAWPRASRQWGERPLSAPAFTTPSCAAPRSTSPSASPRPTHRRKSTSAPQSASGRTLIRVYVFCIYIAILSYFLPFSSCSADIVSFFVRRKLGQRFRRDCHRRPTTMRTIDSPVDFGCG